MTTAIIFVPEGQFDPHASRCMRYCQQRGYDVAGVVTGNWEAAADMLRDGRADAVVVSRPDHLDPHRSPRVEIVAEGDRPEHDQQAGRPEHRRPRPLD